MIAALPGAAKIRAESERFDHAVGQKIRERRLMLGLTQQQLAGLIGVSYQQTFKYESGVNRISAGRLHRIAKALGVDVSYFFETSQQTTTNTQQRRMLLKLVRDFAAIRKREHQEAICSLVRALNGE